MKELWKWYNINYEKIIIKFLKIWCSDYLNLKKKTDKQKKNVVLKHKNIFSIYFLNITHFSMHVHINISYQTNSVMNELCFKRSMLENYRNFWLSTFIHVRNLSSILPMFYNVLKAVVSLSEFPSDDALFKIDLFMKKPKMHFSCISHFFSHV